MTYVIQTLNSGEIDSGFYADFGVFVRFGRHALPTKHFCEFVERLAANPQTRTASIQVYPVDIFWDRCAEQLDGDLKKVLDRDDWSLDLDLSKGDRHQPSVEDEADIFGQRYPITFEVRVDETLVFGEYEMTPSEFAFFARDILIGGSFGWSERPDYVNAAIAAVKRSTNTLFAEIKDFL